MGCDIHIVVEEWWNNKWIGVRTSEGFSLGKYNERWAGSTSPAITARDYNFFARLAGVRGHGPDPLGVPSDASDLALRLIEVWGRDGHSHSYLPLKEFALRWCAADKAFISAMTKERLAGQNRSYVRLLQTASIDAFSGDDESAVDNYRAVFWFDN